ncbi:MAG: hypothetical protein B6241_10830 [Spirochaetaceae bacterium 4572_59]|nr:MAG: hypothetical protein B6241_10830 [Spirochaetaceae bacterium 4572_59]
MDREELVESSSSQNVNIFIAALRKRGTREETIVVSLSEGSSFFIPVDWSDRYPKGYKLKDEDLEKIRRMDSLIRCREWAARFLASKEESSGRLIQKMALRGYEQETSRLVLKQMQDMGFQDDSRFAEQWLILRMKNHPESRACLAAGLSRRGVGREAAGKAIAEYVSSEAEHDMLLRCIRKLIPHPENADEKQIRRLVRRGFSYNSIKRNLTHDSDD